MKILFLADVRSPTARQWIEYFIQKGHEIHCASFYLTETKLAFTTFRYIPIALSSLTSKKPVSNSKQGDVKQKQGYIHKIASPKLINYLRHRLVPLTLTKAAEEIKGYINSVKPDLIHAMRIPYEGMVLSKINADMPKIASVWGNDFSLHAPSTRTMRHLTINTLQSLDGLHTDCWKDLRLARLWGYRKDNILVIPGSGGIKRQVFSPAESGVDRTVVDTPTIVNPRGMRVYIQNKQFFQAVALALHRGAHFRVVCPGMIGNAQVEQWVKQYRISEYVRLLPLLPQAELANLYRQATIVVSPSVHDGTPNSLLEAMACGCLPIAGDLESIREWIVPGVNGLLFNPYDVDEMVDTIMCGLKSGGMQQRAREYNSALIRARADYYENMRQAEAFYHHLL